MVVVEVEDKCFDVVEVVVVELIVVEPVFLFRLQVLVLVLRDEAESRRWRIGIQESEVRIRDTETDMIVGDLPAHDQAGLACSYNDGMVYLGRLKGDKDAHSSGWEIDLMQFFASSNNSVVVLRTFSQP